MYCVMCGAVETARNGLDRCRKSDPGLSHLWAAVGHVRDWFPVGRVFGPDGGIRDARASAGGAALPGSGGTPDGDTDA